VGKSVSATVGGAIYDRVYSFAVLPGSSVLATLTGDLGAEFGLYLFDKGAGSILRDLPLESSAKPGGNQGISTVLLEAGTYYLNVNGRNTDRAHRFTLTVRVERDLTPPTLNSVTVPFRIRSSNACLTISAQDPLTGVDAVLIYERGQQSTNGWQTYRGLRAYCTVIGAGDGTRTLYVKARNRVGLESEALIVSSVVDDTAPQLLKTTPADSGVLTKSRQTVRWVFSEPIRILGEAGSAVYAITPGSGTLNGRYVLSANQRSLIWTPSERLKFGTIVLIGLGSIADRAGNESDQIDALSLTYKREASIGLSWLSGTRGGARFQVDINKALLGKSVSIQGRIDGAWTDLRSVQLRELSTVISVVSSGQDLVRVVWVGSELIAPADSPARAMRTSQ
jgi:hypothetical protein